MLGDTVAERVQIPIPLQHHHFITEDGGAGENVAARISCVFSTACALVWVTTLKLQVLLDGYAKSLASDMGLGYLTESNFDLKAILLKI
jgi:hypothetical protein